MDLESRMPGFNEEKTGLFIPFWLADLFSDGMEYVEVGKREVLKMLIFRVRPVKIWRYNAQRTLLPQPACFWLKKGIRVILALFVKALIIIKPSTPGALTSWGDNQPVSSGSLRQRHNFCAYLFLLAAGN
jgi:hypothetical protein